MSSAQRGVALPVALILLAALALLGAAGLGSAAAAYAVAAHDLRRAQAFEAAELAARAALAGGAWRTATAATSVPATATGLVGVNGAAEIRPVVDDAGASSLEGFSLGAADGGFGVARFTITATGSAPLGALVVIEQDFVVIAPDR